MLATIETLRARLGIPDSSQDEFLTRAAAAATSTLQTYTLRRFA